MSLNFQKREKLLLSLKSPGYVLGTAGITHRHTMSQIGLPLVVQIPSLCHNFWVCIYEILSDSCFMVQFWGMYI